MATHQDKTSKSSEKEPKSRDQASFKPSGDMLTANLLAMLKGWSAYGYDLVQRLEEEGFGDYNKGTVYRTLRQMERTGLVSSMWDTSENGPARRMYELTRAGTLFLDNWIAILDTHKAMLERFSEFADAARVNPTESDENS
ncbi:MAG: helix-turn-helix transcriptional regulator [Pseudomonadota bacterium]